MQGLHQDIDNHKVAVDDLNKAAKDLHGVGAKDPVIDEETSGLTEEYNALAVKAKVKAVTTRSIVFYDLIDTSGTYKSQIVLKYQSKWIFQYILKQSR